MNFHRNTQITHTLYGIKLTPYYLHFCAVFNNNEPYRYCMRSSVMPRYWILLMVSARHCYVTVSVLAVIKSTICHRRYKSELTSDKNVHECEEQNSCLISERRFRWPHNMNYIVSQPTNTELYWEVQSSVRGRETGTSEWRVGVFSVPSGEL